MHLKANMFNKKASDPRYKPDEVIQAVSIKPGDLIADIGAGGGYYSLRFAEITGEDGRVYAIDTNKNYLDFIGSSATKKGFKNIITVLSDGQDMEIPLKQIDVIFMRNVAHHMPERKTYFEGLKKYLKPDGRVVVIDYKQEGHGVLHRPSSHYVTRDTLVGDLSEAGYMIMEEFDFLPEQNFIIFSADK